MHHGTLLWPQQPWHYQAVTILFRSFGVHVLPMFYNNWSAIFFIHVCILFFFSAVILFLHVAIMLSKISLHGVYFLSVYPGCLLTSCPYHGSTDRAQCTVCCADSAADRKFGILWLFHSKYHRSINRTLLNKFCYLKTQN